MKKSLIGGFLSLVGMLGVIAVYVTAAANMVSSWNTPPGRLQSTISELGMTALFLVSWIMLVSGIVAMVIEYFKKEK